MNKTLFVTGAASGIGKATAQLFGRKGWRVMSAATTSTSTEPAK